MPIPRTLTGLALAWFAGSAWADLGFPDHVKFPPQIVVATDQALTKEDLAEAEFESSPAGAKAVQRGRHYRRWFAYKPAAGEPAPGYYNGTEERIWRAAQAALAPLGWQQVWLAENKGAAVLRLQKDGKDAWLRISMDAPQAQVNYEVVEIAAAANPVVFVPPAAKPETFAAQAPIPYLTPYPGSKAQSGGAAPGPLDVTLGFPGGKELVLVGQGTQSRTYQGPSQLSRLQFVRDNREALEKAGWTVLAPAPSETEAAIVIAHYTRNGRDIWARLFYEFGAQLTYTVADVGADDWAAKFERECRVPLYGVLFDFDKASLRPESTPVLEKVAALLKARPAQAVEIQGHTDNVGSDDYNLKLSGARAGSVVQWLTAHQIQASRITSKGYGKTMPVADNGSDLGRAKNRRVELVRAGCGK